MLAVPLWTRWGECSWSGILAPWRLCISARELLWVLNKSRALRTDSCQLVMHLVHNFCSETGLRNATALWDHIRGLLKSGSCNWHQQLHLGSHTPRDLGSSSLESSKDCQLFRENCKFALSRKASYTIKRTRCTVNVKCNLIQLPLRTVYSAQPPGEAANIPGTYTATSAADSQLKLRPELKETHRENLPNMNHPKWELTKAPN